MSCRYSVIKVLSKPQTSNHTPVRTKSCQWARNVRQAVLSRCIPLCSTSFRVVPLSLRMLPMYFIQDVRGLPLGLFPFTFRFSTFFAVVSSSRLITWPNHLNWSVCIVSMIGLILNSSYMSALRILSLLVTPFTNLSTNARSMRNNTYSDWPRDRRNG